MTQIILAVGSIVSSLTVIVAAIAAVARWFQRQDKLDKELSETKEELKIVITALLACLNGLREIGADGPVIEAIARIEKHINEQAHR